MADEQPTNQITELAETIASQFRVMIDTPNTRHRRLVAGNHEFQLFDIYDALGIKRGWEMQRLDITPPNGTYSIFQSEPDDDRTQAQAWDDRFRLQYTPTSDFVQLEPGEAFREPDPEDETIILPDSGDVDATPDPNGGVNLETGGGYSETWQNPVLFEKYAYNRDDKSVLNIIFTVPPSGSMMVGLGSDASKGATSQTYYAGEICLYISSRRAYGFYGKGEVNGWSAFLSGSYPTLKTDRPHKLVIRNSAKQGEVVELYELPSYDKTTWEGTSNRLFQWTSNCPSNQPRVMPMIIPPAGSGGIGIQGIYLQIVE